MGRQACETRTIKGRLIGGFESQKLWEWKHHEKNPRDLIKSGVKRAWKEGNIWLHYTLSLDSQTLTIRSAASNPQATFLDTNLRQVSCGHLQELVVTPFPTSPVQKQSKPGCCFEGCLVTIWDTIFYCESEQHSVRRTERLGQALRQTGHVIPAKPWGSSSPVPSHTKMVTWN